MPHVAFDTFAVEAPRGWADITDTLEAENPPHTLADEDGVGALQFSVALYQGGRVPDPSPADLRKMVERFGNAQGLGKPSAVVAEAGPPVLAASSFAWGDDFLRVRQVSDGRNFAFVTYTCAAHDAGSELPACERIVRSIKFGARDEAASGSTERNA
jgi:hypothetical protein